MGEADAIYSPVEVCPNCGSEAIEPSEEQIKINSEHNKVDLMHQIEEILAGIDKTETESPDGWWETNTGAEFGASKLKELREMVAHLRDH